LAWLQTVEEIDRPQGDMRRRARSGAAATFLSRVRRPATPVWAKAGGGGGASGLAPLWSGKAYLRFLVPYC
jgi:hypothetical protein